MRRVTIITIVIYWIGFWALFFATSVPVPPERGYEVIGPIFEVFHRGVGENLAAAVHTPWMISSFWLNIPCWLITWPLTKLGISGSFLGTNVPGGRLMLITLLSVVQWYFIAYWLQRLVDKKRSGMSSIHQYDAD